MYRLFIANRNYSSWSLRPWALMTALAIPFEEEVRLFDPVSGAGAFADFSPTGKVPCLHAGQEVIWESLAIVEFLAETHTGVWPGDPLARAWSRCACAEMHAGFAALRGECPMSVGVRIRLHRKSPALLRDVARMEALWDAGLVRFGGPWLAGRDFSAVDAFFAPVAFRIRTYGLELGEPAAAYAHRLLGHPALLAWEQAALQETARDASHEGEILALGTLLADHRN